MPERVPADALHAAAARLRAVEARVGGLGASCDARLAALEARWAALPQAAAFDPFGWPAARRDVAADTPDTSDEAVRRRRQAAPPAPSMTARRVPELPKAASTQPLAASLGGAVAAAMASLVAMPRRGAANDQVRRDTPKAAPAAAGRAGWPEVPGPAIRAAFAAPSVSPSVPTPRPKPVAKADPEAASVAVGQALAAVGSSLRSVADLAPGIGTAASGRAPMRSRSGAAGPGLLQSLAAAELIERGLAAIAPAKRRASPRAPLRDADADPSRAAPALAQVAPRAPSRLLAPTAAPAGDVPAKRTPVIEASAEPSDPLAELNRQLIDQAWLRGVDLS